MPSRAESFDGTVSRPAATQQPEHQSAPKANPYVTSESDFYGSCELDHPHAIALFVSQRKTHHEFATTLSAADPRLRSGLRNHAENPLPREGMRYIF
ncbi:hypothetical protein ALC57_11620 [Trachymyrmex cornetzi]|uniref:Uncharacterized protein n=1 Tax=Trachymyrmex cornetzi TaxID=471704 RepID=A0A195DT42_9HYME|nr:hypothetical protein ALC57_11620 [Trachymyrmex cornetzi]